MKNIIAWCLRYEILFRTIYEDEELREFFRKYDAYRRLPGHHGIYNLLKECLHAAYDAGVVVTDYREIIEADELPKNDVAAPTKEWVSTLSERQILACIAWHFRRDHFAEGSWIRESVADGHMLILVQGLLSMHGLLSKAEDTE